jgi:hypothetical protein
LVGHDGRINALWLRAIDEDEIRARTRLTTSGEDEKKCGGEDETNHTKS